MTARVTRRALRRTGAIEVVEQQQLEINYLTRHNQALALFLRGAIRAYGGGFTDPRLAVAKEFLAGEQDRIVAMPLEDRIVLTLEPEGDDLVDLDEERRSRQ